MSMDAIRFFARTAPSVHGGIDDREIRQLRLDPTMVIDFSSNQSPLGPSPLAVHAMQTAMIDRYPDRDALSLAEALAARHGVSPSQVVTGNGTTEIIRLIAQLAIGVGDRALIFGPTFGEYAVATELAGGTLHIYPLSRKNAFQPQVREWLAAVCDCNPRIAWICSPNNPTGTVMPAGAGVFALAAH